MNYRLKDNVKEVLLSNQELPQLTNLINQLNTHISNNDKSIQFIRNPKQLVNSLIKLYNVVGMNDIKESIAKQTYYLMNKLEQGETSMKMLNTVLYGEPGVGKTKIGVILSEIWQHLGFLQQAKLRREKTKSYLDMLSGYNMELLQFYLIISIFVLSQLYTHVLLPLYILYDVKFLISLLCLFCLGFIFYVSQEKETSEESIVITSRSTFVNIYLGGTAHQTENFLNENRGKVVFIDEAYSLYNGYSDSYGVEALSSINKYMSEHEDEIVIIFAGYEELLKNTIFKVQPGLNRRCMWKFNCKSYSGEELYEIFKIQLSKENYLLEDNILIRELIIKYKDEFVNHAGSTEQLAFFSQLNHSIRLSHDKLIIYEDVKYALKELIENTIAPVKQDLMSEFKKYL